MPHSIEFLTFWRELNERAARRGFGQKFNAEQAEAFFREHKAEQARYYRSIALGTRSDRGEWSGLT